ncbi:uncharacterized protein LOC134031610 [Osmerus eperlanus]|uniref:uncharacterized protein LOC134031610 n=1 Tax=Osmerus eperlanus TaxID=29151 RepID=UPI002E11FA76
MPVLQRWKVSRLHLINSMLSDEAVLPTTCQWCRQGVAVMRCSECLPHQYLCMACDKEQHTRHVLHNRRSLISGYLHPLPPTSFVSQDADGQYSLTHQGRYDLVLPEAHCQCCASHWRPGLEDVVQSGYWPGPVNVNSLFHFDVLQSYLELKMSAAGLSRLTFTTMLDKKNNRFGRSGKISGDTFHQSFMEWAICRYEVDKMCQEQPFVCPPCTPEMLAVAVDGNRKHYRQDSHGHLEGVFLCEDSKVAEFVDHVHKATKHPSSPRDQQGIDSAI